MGKKNYGEGRPTSKDIIHLELDGKPVCGIAEGRIFVTWVYQRVECPECLSIIKNAELLVCADCGRVYRLYESLSDSRCDYCYMHATKHIGGI